MNLRRQEMLTNYAEARRDSLRKSLEHRLEVAKAKGDEQLVQQLEAESRQIV